MEQIKQMEETLTESFLDHPAAVSLVARTGHVTRWHSVVTNRDQTLAEHHYLVTMYVVIMVDKIFGQDIKPDKKLLLFQYAMNHDLFEVISGDIPSPFKEAITSYCKDANIGNPLDDIEMKMIPFLTTIKEQIKHEPFFPLVKIADLLDACVFIKAEGVGPHSKKVAEGLEQKLQKRIDDLIISFPEYAWNKISDLYEILLEQDQSKVKYEQLADLII